MRLFIVFKMQLFLVVFNCVADRDNFFQIAISCDVAFVVARREEREAVQSTVLLSGGDVETILSIKGMRKSVMRTRIRKTTFADVQFGFFEKSEAATGQWRRPCGVRPHSQPKLLMAAGMFPSKLKNFCRDQK